MRPIIALFGAVALSLAAQQPAETVLDKWLASFNSADRAHVEAFMKVHEPRRLDRLDETLQMREMTGGLVKVKVEQADATSITALLKEKTSGGYARLQMTVDAEPPHVIRGLSIDEATPPAELAPQRGSVREAAQAAFAYARQQDFSGVVLVAGADGKVHVESFGLADREAKVANNAETLFRIGSMNKMMTSVAALQLVERGKLKLDEPIGNVLSDYPNEKVRTQVTLRHLLTHTGGTGDIFTPEYEARREQVRTIDDYVKLFGHRDPEFAPGTSARYSNYGFVLVGKLIERASGMDYYAYIQKNIYDVAGMKKSGSEPESLVGSKISKGYMRKGETWESNVNTLPWRASPAGGGYTTAGDLHRFALALEGGKLLGKELYASATKDQKRTSRPYGLGFNVREDSGRFYGHGGGAPGMNAELRVYPESGVVVVVLSNLDPPAAGRVTNFIDARLPLTR